ncbi:glycoside hydrolase family 43 protein [Hortaea werneckii]|nr:glycoside hydrolase family 43 protein [Hortaea werneckii]KAI7315163.1 glycoside hydrolase family 43 protein [Hortaea werneckii]
MFELWSRWSLLVAVVQLCASSPLPVAEVSLIERANIKRSMGGPLIGGANFPDPSVIQVGNTWYAFATRTIGSSIHIQVAQSTDFNNWNIVKNADGSQKDALPNLPSWVYGASPNTWAPDVIQINNKFVMYYSATTTADTSKHCVGAATANTVTGPYTPVGNSALVCPLAQGGAIDASGYYDFATGKRYITYKIDGNAIGNGGACGNNVAPYVSTAIKLQQVAANDGVTLQGGATTILDNIGAADQGIVEAPALVKSGSNFFLFFSNGCFTKSAYTVNYATSTSITGPYTRAASPLFATGQNGLTTPGGMDVFRDGKHMLFHANSGSGRAMYNAIITINGKTVTA